ncbi:hypothetical protein PHISCL_06451 [Aspergillus sclerotialis]|uniref:Uncharacterized protein n=1 Tax=Aspergillus sclerotialis TaxID=2070753 RepID=A0A3A2ZDI8_9EURO|nr:hypothetical protein PHISCL_06451 [Aspergillus sclerotialis]
MDPVILAVAFIGMNIWGMYGNIPFTGINPTTTFFDRFLGSVQVTSVIYALQDIHPKVFPEVLDPPPSETTPNFPLPPKTQEVVRTVTEYVKLTAGFSSPTHGFGNGTSSNQTDLQLVSRVYDDIPSYGWYFPKIWLSVYPVVSAFAIFLIWEVIRKIVRPKEKDKVVLDATLFAQLVAALNDEFKHRHSSQVGEEEDADSVARRANIIGVLDLVKIPPRSQLEDDPPTIESLIDMSQRISRAEEFIKCAFPYTGQGDAKSSGDGSSGPEPGTALQESGQKKTTTYKAAFDKAMNDIDESVNNYAKITNELRQASVAQETIQQQIRTLQYEFKNLKDAMAPTSDSGSDQMELSETEGSDARRYTDEKIKMSNTVCQAKYNMLGEKLATLDDNFRKTLEVIRDRQTKGFQYVEHKIKDALQTPAGQLFDKTQLSKLVGESILLDKTIRELVSRSNIAIKTLGENREGIRNLKELKEQVEKIYFTTALVTAENEKIWETIKTISPENVPKRVPGDIIAAAPERKSLGDDAESASSTVPPGVATKPSPRSSSTASVGGQMKDDPKELPKPEKKAKKPKEPNLYDAETEPESEEDEDPDSTRPPSTEKQISESSKVDQTPPVTGEGDTKPLSKTDRPEGEGDSKEKKLQEIPQDQQAPSNKEPVPRRTTTRAFDFFNAAGHGEVKADGIRPLTEQEKDGKTRESPTKVGKETSGEQQTGRPEETTVLRPVPMHSPTITARKEETSKQHAQPDNSEEKKQIPTVPQQTPMRPKGLFDPTKYGHKEHMKKIHSKSPAAGKQDSPKQEAQIQKAQTEKPPMQAEDALQPSGPSVNAVSHGLRQRMAPFYPPAATKKDYQPTTPKDRTQFDPDQKGKQTKGQRRPIDQPTPNRQIGTAGEQKKVAGWNTFGAEARAKEREEHEKYLKEAQKYESTPANWETNLKWKQAKTPSETGIDSGDGGSHLPAQETATALTGATEKDQVGEQSQTTQPPPISATAASSPQTRTGSETNTQAKPKDQDSQGKKGGDQEKIKPEDENQRDKRKD